MRVKLLLSLAVALLATLPFIIMSCSETAGPSNLELNSQASLAELGAIFDTDAKGYSTSVQLVNASVTTKDLVALRSLEKLESLDLSNTALMADALLHIDQEFQPALTSLVLSNTGITGDGLKNLNRATQIQHLVLSENAAPNNEDMQQLAAFVALESVDLSGCQQLTDPAVELLTSLPRLSRINMAGTGVSDDAITLLARASKSRATSCRQYRCFRSRLSDTCRKVPEARHCA